MRVLTALFLGAIALACLIAPARASSPLHAALQTPAVMANRNINIDMWAHDGVVAPDVAWIKSYDTTGLHGSIWWKSSRYLNYTPGSYYATLPKGKSATETFPYCLTDSLGAVSCNKVVVTIFGTATPAPPPPPPPPPPAPPPPPPPTTTNYTCVRNFYVATNGSDAASGVSVIAPWQTMQHANDSGQLRAGDCVNVADGTYPIQWSLNLSNGGNTNSATGYVVYRSSNPHGAKLQAAGAGMYDVVDANANYLILDGFEVDGGNEGLSANPVTNGACIASANAHHVQALNNMPHDCGGGGIEFANGDWYTISGNLAYNNAHFNGWQMSGISIYEPRAVSYAPSPADIAATYHIVVQNNVSHDNDERYVPFSPTNPHTDGNGIIMDDFRNDQTSGAYPAYPFKSLVQGNTVYNNGGKGIQVFTSDNVTVDSNIAYHDNLDAEITGTWRGELNNQFANGTVWSNNKATTASTTSGVLSNNTAVLDGGSSGTSWTGNATFDTRTGQMSYSIDNAGAANFPANNPLGGPLP